MKSFVPEAYIICENCYKSFLKYTHIHTYIDVDDIIGISKEMTNNTINRVECPYCNTEFTYETAIFAYSQTIHFAVISNFDDKFVNTSFTKRAFEISGLSDWTLRRCRFTMDSSEKIRIFKAGLNDGTMELLKLSKFPEYRNMDLDDEYIVFEYSDGENLVFSHRDFTGKLLKTYPISMCEYSLMCDVNIPRGEWITADRDWAINFMEAIRK